jgi:SAM-dependent methyltransferase
MLAPRDGWIPFLPGRAGSTIPGLEAMRMPDVYAIITEADPAEIEQVATAMEASAADPQHQAMTVQYLSQAGIPPYARVLEIGSGTGAISRMLADWPKVRAVVGVDPSPDLLARARQLAAGLPNVSFQQGDGRDLPFETASFDVVVIHRVLSHVPEPEAVLAEAGRVLRPGGSLAVFDGDYSTITLSTGAADPLAACVEAFTPACITDPWVVRRLPALVRDAGFTGGRLHSHGFVQTSEPGDMLSIADRGADALAAAGRIGPGLAAALKAEARRRVEAGSFFGHVAYASLIARKPG